MPGSGRPCPLLCFTPRRPALLTACSTIPPSALQVQGWLLGGARGWAVHRLPRHFWPHRGARVAARRWRLGAGRLGADALGRPRRHVPAAAALAGRRRSRPYGGGPLATHACSGGCSSRATPPSVSTQLCPPTSLFSLRTPVYLHVRFLHRLPLSAAGPCCAAPACWAAMIPVTS